MRSSSEWYTITTPQYLVLHILNNLLGGKDYSYWQKLPWRNKQMLKYYSTVKAIKEYKEREAANIDSSKK